LIPFIFLPFFAMSFLACLISVRKESKLYLIFKPLTMIFVIMICIFSFFSKGSDTRFSSIILIGLLLSIVGDIALMFRLPDKSNKIMKVLFLIGLCFFFFAHISYIIAFSIFNGFFTQDITVGIVAIILVIMLFAVYTSKGDMSKSLRIPTFMYMSILGFMLTKALSTSLGSYFSDLQATIIVIGAVMFTMSDIILGFRTYVNNSIMLRIILLALYFPAQLMFALSCYYFSA